MRTYFLSSKRKKVGKERINGGSKLPHLSATGPFEDGLGRGALLRVRGNATNHGDH
jgi:hypothetical protein